MYFIIFIFCLIHPSHSQEINPYQFKYQFRRHIKNTFQLKGHQVSIKTRDLNIKTDHASWSGAININGIRLSQLVDSTNKDFLFDAELDISHMKVIYRHGKIYSHDLLAADTNIQAKLFVSKNSLNDLIAQHIDSEKKLNVFVFDIKDKQFILHAKGGGRFGGVRFFVQSQAFMRYNKVGIQILDQKIHTYGLAKMKHNSFKEMLIKKVHELQFEIPNSKLFNKIRFTGCEVGNKGVYLQIQKTSLNHDNIMISKLIQSNFD
ncbi:MAG: hypothetical protein KC646_00715 [Candidatus Cloacimonetes bacterium]|nr:hypothetical protein [Candidatus Cloacimonadota bacterium]